MNLKKINFEDKEKRFYKWLIDYRYRVALIILLAVIFLNIARLPYLNLIFNKDTNILILAVVSILTFKIRVHDIFKVGIILFIFAFIFQVIQKTGTAELLANCTFAVFVVGTIKGILEIKDKNFFSSQK